MAGPSVGLTAWRPTDRNAAADDVAMLHGGVIRWTGPATAMDAAADPYLRQFVEGRAEGPIETLR